MEKNRTPILYRENDKFIYEGDLGMKTNERQTSAKKKLIPAVAMLTASAVMLTTATYAWFTLNKTVEVKGLKMTATASDALEISLGSVASGTNKITNVKVQPNDTADEISWTKLINVSDYYSEVGYISPASSVNGISFFEAVDPSNAGMTATKFSEVGAGKNAKTTVRDNKEAGTLKSKDDSTYNGYYLDIPVHLRTSKSTGDATNNVYCKMKITDPDDQNEATPEGKTDNELYRAVRVAFIPTNIDGTISGEAAASIWGATDTNYDSTKAVAKAGEKSATDTMGDPGVITKLLEGTDTNIDIPNATEAGKYGHVDFVIRVWLEGESTYCHDANAAQDWNIDFAFAIDKSADNTAFTSWGTADQG